MLQKPEFGTSDKMLNLLDVLEQRNLTKLIPFREISADGVTVMIGAENEEDAMHDYSVVDQPVRRAGRHQRRDGRRRADADALLADDLDGALHRRADERDAGDVLRRRGRRPLANRVSRRTSELETDRERTKEIAHDDN